MKASGVISYQAGDVDLEQIAEEIGRDNHLLKGEELVGDLLLLLAQPQVNFANKIGADLEHYAWMLGEISHGQRWQILRKSIGRRMRRKPIARNTGTPDPYGHEAPQDSRHTALRYVTEMLARSLRNMRGSGTLRDLAIRFEDQLLEVRDKSSLLVTDYVLLMAEFARRGKSYNFLHALLDTALAQLCVSASWDQEEYEPRMLEIVHFPGEKEERLPGDLFGVRGVTVKTREDQLRELLPSEFAPIQYGGKREGEFLVVDKILNRSPLIFEHFHTTQPESRHRTLVLLIAGAERPWNQPQLPWMTPHARSRLAVFEMLCDLAQKVPHEHVRVDIAILAKENSDSWSGAFFPLEVMQPREQPWRNVLEVDALLPTFFAQFGVAHHARRSGVEFLSLEPAACAARFLSGGTYRSVVVAGFGMEKDVGVLLPPPSTMLPRFDSQTPAVIVGCFEDDGSVGFTPFPAASGEGNNQGESPPDFVDEAAPEGSMPPMVPERARQLRGSAFRDLLSAHIAPQPLPETTLAELSTQLLTMVIGPLREIQSVEAL